MVGSVAPPESASGEPGSDGAQLLARQSPAAFGPIGASPVNLITVDDAHRFQAMDGFGAAITDSSAQVLMHDASASQRAAVLRSLFGRQSGIALDYVRVPIGGNDFSTSSYTEDDVATGKRDPSLDHFSGRA